MLREKLFHAAVLSVCVLFAFSGFSCRKKQKPMEQADQTISRAEEEAAAKARPEETVSGTLLLGAGPGYAPPRTHRVYEGETLWSIAAYKDIYGDPYQWPLIYDANREAIEKEAKKRGLSGNPENWIFPGQVLTIPREVPLEKIKQARKRAGAPPPYLPPGH